MGRSSAIWYGDASSTSIRISGSRDGGGGLVGRASFDHGDRARPRRRLQAGPTDGRPDAVQVVDCRPPPSRPSGRSGPSSSSKQRPIVERAIPVISCTAIIPPWPAVLASTAAKCRRPRSWSFEPNSRHLRRIDSRSIMTERYSAMPASQIGHARVNTTQNTARPIRETHSGSASWGRSDFTLDPCAAAFASLRCSARVSLCPHRGTRTVASSRDFLHISERLR
jgi:hypothetical protein